jgi:hypothetical protein
MILGKLFYLVQPGTPDRGAYTYYYDCSYGDTIETCEETRYSFARY